MARDRQGRARTRARDEGSITTFRDIIASCAPKRLTDAIRNAASRSSERDVRDIESAPAPHADEAGPSENVLYAVPSDGSLWAGLARGDDLPRAVVCGVLADGGGAARAVRSISASLHPVSRDMKLMELRVEDAGDASHGELEERARDLASAGVPFAFFGGSAASSAEVLRGVDEAVGSGLGIVRAAAEPCLLDEQSDRGAMRAALDLPSILSPEQLFFVATRSAQSSEAHFLQRSGAGVLTSAKIRRLGARKAAKRIKKAFKALRAVYVSIDVDAMDPAFAAASERPCPGGLDPLEFAELTANIMRELPVIGFDISAHAQCAHLAARTILECLHELTSKRAK